MKRLEWLIFIIGFIVGVMCTMSLVGTFTRSINDEIRALHLEHELMRTKTELNEVKMENEMTASKAASPEKTIKFTYKGEVIDQEQ